MTQFFFCFRLTWPVYSCKKNTIILIIFILYTKAYILNMSKLFLINNRVTARDSEFCIFWTFVTFLLNYQFSHWNYCFIHVTADCMKIIYTFMLICKCNIFSKKYACSILMKNKKTMSIERIFFQYVHKLEIKYITLNINNILLHYI